jgi:UDP-glucose:(heptosyl)LPS alpha-1,3-glucosyltransferase
LGRVLSPKQWVSGWIENAPYRRKNLPRIIAISDMVKLDIMRWYGIPEDQIDVIYNGVDIERFNPRNRRYREEIRKRYEIGEEVVLLFVSNNFRMKGLGFLMRALADIKKEDHPPFKLLILGRGRKGPYLRLSKKLGISEEMVFAGSTDEIEKYYGAADLLVHPSFYDACSLTVLEALASGLPVITTSSNGASGRLRQGEDGWVTQKPTDVNQLGQVIKKYLDHPLRPVRDRVEDYSEKINFDKVITIFKDFLEQRQGDLV